jgi:hypothetical protein
LERCASLSVSADFERFVARHFGPRGRAWLDELPEHA